MRQILLLALLVICNASFAQDHPFLSASSKIVPMSTYVDHLNTFPEKKRDSINNRTPKYRDDGAEYTKAYSDSIFKSKESYKYRTLVYKDTLANSYAYVLHKQTEEEMKAFDDAWKKNMEDDKKNRESLLGTKIEELSLTDMDGNMHTLETLKGKIIVLDFWFVNCGACIEDMPALNRLRDEYGTEDVAWFGITFDKKEKVVKFLEKKKFDYSLIPDGKQLVDRFSIKYFPTTLIIDPTGKIVFTGRLDVGDRTKETGKALKKAVKDLKKSRKG
jgi:peroxiredoxin